MRVPLAFAPLLGLILILTGCKEKPPGQKRYGPNCGICHHNGTGQTGEFPPLVGRLDIIARTSEGQKFLASVMINGLNGPIMANGARYNFAMPPFARLRDDDLALILNWLIARGETTPPPVMSPRIFSEAREAKIGPEKTRKLRLDLQKKGLIP